MNFAVRKNRLTIALDEQEFNLKFNPTFNQMIVINVAAPGNDVQVVP